MVSASKPWAATASAASRISSGLSEPRGRRVRRELVGTQRTPYTSLPDPAPDGAPRPGRSALRELGDRLPLAPGLEPALVVLLRDAERRAPEERAQRRLVGVDDPQNRFGRRRRVARRVARAPLLRRLVQGRVGLE